MGYSKELSNNIIELKNRIKKLKNKNKNNFNHKIYNQIKYK